MTVKVIHVGKTEYRIVTFGKKIHRLLEVNKDGSYTFLGDYSSKELAAKTARGLK